MPITEAQAVAQLVDQLTVEERRAMVNSDEKIDELRAQSRAISRQSTVEEAYNVASMDQRERILRGVLTGPEAKVSAFALATKTFPQLPDYVRQSLYAKAK